MMASYSDPSAKSRPKETVMSTSLKKSLAEGLNEELTCAICFDRYNQPKVLPCLHLYCESCLENMAKKSWKKSLPAVTCPQCQSKHHLPPSGVKGFRTYFMINNLLELLRVHEALNKSENSTVESVLYCESGLDEKQPATARCITCRHYLCNSCLTIHQKQNITKDHKVLLLEEITVSDKAEGIRNLVEDRYCEEHKKEVLKLFCKTCKKVICRDCALVKCRSHDYTFLQDVRQEIHASLKSLTGDVKAKRSHCETLIDSLRETSASDTRQLKACESAVYEHFRMLANALERRREALLNEVLIIHKEKQKQIAAQSNSLSSVHTRLSTSIAFTEQLLENADDVEVVTLSTQAKQTLEEQKSMTMDKTVKPSYLQAVFVGKIMEDLGNYGQIDCSQMKPVSPDSVFDIENSSSGSSSLPNEKVVVEFPKIVADWPEIGYVLTEVSVEIEVVETATNLDLFDIEVVNNGVELGDVLVKEKNFTTLQVIFLPGEAGQCSITVAYMGHTLETHVLKVMDVYDQSDIILKPKSWTKTKPVKGSVQKKAPRKKRAIGK